MRALGQLLPRLDVPDATGNAAVSDVPWELDLTIIDLETTGVDIDRDQIVEIGAIRVKGLQRELFHTLVDPGVPIPPTASAVHHITDEDVHGAPTIAEVLPKLREFAMGSTVVAHYAKFEASMLARASNVQADPSKWLCTYRLARHIYPLAPSHSNWALTYWLKLTPAITGFGAHRAPADAAATAELCLRLLQRTAQRGIRSTADAIAFSSRPIPWNGEQPH